MPKFNQLANLLTGLSLVSGFISIIFSLESHFTFASWAIILAVVFDGLDGQVARRDTAPNEFGKELDSLVDVISFGVAPSILGYAFVYKKFHIWATLALFFYLCCSVYRLAKYNITVKKKFSSHFTGLPTTISGAVLASFILIYRSYTQSPPPSLFLFLVFLLAVLMVSRVKYINLDGVKDAFRNSRLLFILVISALISVPFIFYLFTGALLTEISIFVLFVVYLFSPLFLDKFV